MPSYNAHNRCVLRSDALGGMFTLLRVERAQIADSRRFLPSPRAAVFSAQKVAVTRIKRRICEASGTSGDGKVSNFTAQ